MESVLQFFRNNAFLITLTGVVAGLFYFWYGLRKDQKRLHCWIERNVLIDASAINALSKLQVKYEDAVIEKLYSTDIRIKNVGRKGLSPSDVPEEWTISFSAAVLEFSVQTSPSEHKVLLTEGNVMRIKPGLLNPTEQVRITVLTISDEDPQVVIRALDFESSVGTESTEGRTVIDPVALIVGGILVVTIFLGLLRIVEFGTEFFSTTKKELGLQSLVNVRNDVAIMGEIRKIERLVRAKAAHDGVRYVPFDSNDLPAWAASESAILSWGGPVEDNLRSIYLEGGNIRVSTSTSILKLAATGKSISPEAVAFVINDKEHRFGYKGISDRGDFVPN